MILVGVVQPDEFHWVYPCLHIPCSIVRKQVWVHFLRNRYTSGILIPWATLMAVRVKVHELPLLPTMLAHIFPPSLSHRQVLFCKHEGLPLGNIIKFHVPVLVNGVHLSDSIVLNRNILVAS